MILIPTVTGLNKQYDIQLISPSLKKKNTFGSIFTIIDCHTYYLRNFLRDKNSALQHYYYYIDFVNDNQLNPELIFILPDWCWLKDKIEENKLKDKWLEKIKTNKILYTITNINCNDYIGIAGRNLFKTDIKWYHNFGKYLTTDIIPKNILYTYDSQDHSNLNEKLLRQTCSIIQTLL